MRQTLVQAEQVNEELEKLPRAEEVGVAWANVKADAYVPIRDRKGILVKSDRHPDGVIIDVPTDEYVLVQHKDALRPVIDALTVTGNHDFRFSFYSTDERAWMNVYVGEGYDTVRYGFSVINSYDRSSSLKYGFEGFRKTKIIEIVGYRQVCSNGMKIRVPIDNAEFVKPEEREEIETLLVRSLRIRHTGDVESKMQSVQPIVEAFMLLRNPLQRIIEAAQSVAVEDKDTAQKLVDKYVGKRLNRKVLDQFVEKQQKKSLWGLYNALTFVASHDEVISESSRNALINKASVMLEKELETITE